MKIGTVAKQVGISVEAIRFYEKQGLINTPIRNDSGYRVYSADITNQLMFVTRAKELGFSLKEIKELLLLRSNRVRLALLYYSALLLISANVNNES